MPPSAPIRMNYINAHGTSTPLGLAETKAIKITFKRSREEAGPLIDQDARSSARCGGVATVFTNLSITANLKITATINLFG